ncbi:uncharacterized protein LOC134252138, partial [Saccostrea cucullata]|uniref:uncharacterized protein LOC134252138 n=1 Tax=Saccostrea cuccullata TaxID=36930 RepID=UPI002ED64C0B
GYVGCAYKGWGTGYAASLALLVISAWILPAEDILFTQTITVAKNSVHPNILPISPTVSTDNHLFVVKVKADDGANAGFVFHGSGTSLTDGSLTNYGGVIYAYDESEVLLWRPSDDNTNGYILYMGGDLGGGAYPQMSTQGDVTVSIIRTLTPYEGNCGVGTCVGNWSQIIVVCDCVGTGLSGQYCTKATSPPPSSLLAGVKDEEESRLLHLGSKRNLTINLEFPIETSPDIVVVIKASSSKEVMALASASVTGKGNNIQPFSTRLYYSFSSSSMISGFYFIFSGNLSLGDLVNSGSSNIYRDNMVTIISEIFVQSINDVTNGEQHKVNVMILVDGVGVWEKDISYIISTYILTPIKTPEIYPRYPSTSYLERGTMTRVTVDLWMPLANPDIVVISRSTTGGEDTKLRVFRVAVTKVGENYQLPVILERYNVVGTVCNDVTGNKTLYLTFPTHFANK